MAVPLSFCRVSLTLADNLHNLCPYALSHHPPPPLVPKVNFNCCTFHDACGFPRPRVGVGRITTSQDWGSILEKHPAERSIDRDSDLCMRTGVDEENSSIKKRKSSWKPWAQQALSLPPLSNVECGWHWWNVPNFLRNHSDIYIFSCLLFCCFNEETKTDKWNNGEFVFMATTEQGNEVGKKNMENYVSVAVVCSWYLVSIIYVIKIFKISVWSSFHFIWVFPWDNCVWACVCVYLCVCAHFSPFPVVRGMFCRTTTAIPEIMNNHINTDGATHQKY